MKQYEKILVNACKCINAKINFNEITSNNIYNISAIVTGSKSEKEDFEIRSQFKDNKDDACLAILKIMIFSDIAASIGIPVCSSIDELELKLKIMFP